MPYKTFVRQVSHIYEPQFYHDAVKYLHWQQAMWEELAALKSNKTLTLQSLPLGKKDIGCKWIYKVKYKSDGSLDRYKVCLSRKWLHLTRWNWLPRHLISSNKVNYRQNPACCYSSVLLAITSVGCQQCFLEWYLGWKIVYQTPLRLSHQGGESSMQTYEISIWTYTSILIMVSNLLYANEFQKCEVDYSLFTKGQGTSLVVLLVYVDELS